MEQTCRKKGKVNKMHVFSHFLFLFFYLEFKRLVLLKSKIVDEYAEKPDVPHPQIYQSVFPKSPLKFILGGLQCDLDMGWTRSSVLEVGGGVSQPVHGSEA